MHATLIWNFVKGTWHRAIFSGRCERIKILEDSWVLMACANDSQYKMEPEEIDLIGSWTSFHSTHVSFDRHYRFCPPAGCRCYPRRVCRSCVESIQASITFHWTEKSNLYQSTGFQNFTLGRRVSWENSSCWQWCSTSATLFPLYFDRFRLLCLFCVTRWLTQ